MFVIEQRPTDRAAHRQAQPRSRGHQLEWVVSGYMLASAAALIVAGSMGVAVLGTVFFGSLSSAHPIGEVLGIWRMNRPGRAG